MASKMLAFAAIIMMGLAFASCSKDENDTPKPDIPLGENYVVFDDHKEKIVTSEYKHQGSDNYMIRLNLANTETLEIQYNKRYHVKKTVYLDKHSKKFDDNLMYWTVIYWNKDPQVQVYATSEPGEEVFLSGTLRINGSPLTKLKIQMRDARVIGRDGIEHTIAADFDGKPSKMGK